MPTKAANTGNGYPSGMKNAIVNGKFQIDQRNAGAAQTITAAAALAYTADRWYAYCTGANTTGQRITVGTLNRYRITGATSVTAVGFGQRIEAVNSMHMAGVTCTLSAKLSSTSLTSVTWTAYYANTADTFGTLASPTRTQFATGTFTITTTETTYSANVVVSASATTGIEIVFTGGALVASQTLTFGDVQLELGSVATPFEHRPYGAELALCQRYFYKVFDPSLRGVVTAAGSVNRCASRHPVTMRAVPTVTLSGNLPVYDGVQVSTLTTIGASFNNVDFIELDMTGAASLTASRPACCYYVTGSSSLSVSAEL